MRTMAACNGNVHDVQQQVSISSVRHHISTDTYYSSHKILNANLFVHIIKHSSMMLLG